MRRIIMGLLAVLALSAMATSSAYAKATFTLKTAKGSLAPGQEMSILSANLLFEIGEIACSSTSVRMTVGSTDTVASVTGVDVMGEGPSGACVTAIGAPSTEEPTGLPWSMRLRIPGNSKPGVITLKRFAFTSTFPTKGNPKLVTTGARLSSAFNLGGPISVVLEGRVRNKGQITGGISINTGGSMRLAGNLTSEGEPVEAELTGK